MDVISLIAHTAAYGACLACVNYASLRLIGALDLQWLVARLLALAILNCAQIVIAVEILSLAHSITLLNLLLIHGSVWAVLILIKSKPANLLVFTPRELFQKIRTNTDGPLQLLLSATILAAVTTFFLALYVPPNNHDSMAYHLARVGYYLQQGSLNSYPTPNIRQTVFPANAEVLILWQVALLRSDITAGLVQWLSWIGSILAVYGIARQLRSPPIGALFAGLAFASFPEIILQSSSTQNDLVATFFLLCAFLFVAEIIQAPIAGAVLAGVSLGLALGTKTLTLFIIPGFLLYSLVWLACNKRFAWRRAGGLLLACVLGFLLCGSYFFIQNYFLYGDVTGPESIMRIHSLDRFEWNVAWSNFGRSVMQFLSPNGIVSIGQPLGKVVTQNYMRNTENIFRYLNISPHIPGKDFFNARWTEIGVLAMHEDTAMYGPLFGYLGLLLIAIQLIYPGPFAQTARKRALAFAVVSFWILVAALLRWQFTIGRLMVPMVAISSPLLARLYSTNGKYSKIWNGVLVLVCVSCLSNATLYNEMKPILGSRTFWQKDRIQLMTLDMPGLDPMIRFIEGLKLNGLRLGLVSDSPAAFEYPLFGRHFKQTLVPIRIESEDQLDLRNLPDVDALLIQGEAQQFFSLSRSKSSNQTWLGRTDLHPLLDQLRDSKAGWQPVLDVDGLGHLFTRREVHVDPAAFSVLPVFLPGEWNAWPDHWVRNDFVASVRLDPDKPTLHLEGETPGLGYQPTIKVEGPDSKLLGVLEPPQGGRFTATISLAPLLIYNVRYVLIHIRSNLQFNPKKLGQSSDDRDLSWRLLEIKLSSERAAGAAEGAADDGRHLH